MPTNPSSGTGLVAIDRQEQRSSWLGRRVFEGFGSDIWRTSECTWLDRRGKPVRGDLTVKVPSDSPSMVESKSLKLFLMGLAMSKFETKASVEAHICGSLSGVVGTDCDVELQTRTVGFTFDESFIEQSHRLDYIPLEMNQFAVSRETLAPRRSAHRVSGRYHTDSFRCLCPLSGQPDYATVVIDLTNAWLSAESLLAYLLSYRTHCGFHESTIERVFADIRAVCQPERLAVFASFARRGGIDIAVFRSTVNESAPNWRSPIS